MVAYAFLFLFVTAAVLLIVRSHYRWTYFFASALFVFLAGGMLMLTAQWQRALNFASVWFVVLILFHRLKIHYYKQPLLISDFLLIADWRNWETLFHYKEAVIGMAGLLALAAYAVFGWSGADSLGMPWRWAGAVLFAAAFVSVRHFSKHPGAVKTWLDSLPDDGRDVFLNLPMSCRAVFFQVPVFEGDGEAFARQMPSETRPYGMSDEKPDIVVTLMESTLDPHCFDFAAAKIPDLKMFGRQEILYFPHLCACILSAAQRGSPNLRFWRVFRPQISARWQAACFIRSYRICRPVLSATCANTVIFAWRSRRLPRATTMPRQHMTISALI